MSKFAITFVLGLLSLLTPGAFASGGSTASKPGINVPRPNDAQLDQIIRTKLAKSKIGKDGFKYSVKGGVVTWEGSTNVIQHKGAATRMARTAGAANVVNNIKISDEARLKAAGNLHRAQVKTN